MQQGYIKLYRQLLENPLWTEKPFSRGQAWVDLLLTANYADNKIMRGNQMVTVPRCCIVTSESYLMNRWGWSKCKVRGFLELLASEDMIERKADHQKTTISIRKYSTFQGSEIANRPPIDHEQTANRPPIDRNKEGKKNNKAKNIPPYTPPQGEAAGRLCKAYEKYFGNLPRAAVENMRKCLAEGMTEGLIERILSETAAAEPRKPMQYIQAVIDRCRASGITTAEQFEEANKRDAAPGRGAGRAAQPDLSDPKRYEKVSW